MTKSLFAVSLVALGHLAVAQADGMPPYTLDPGPHAGNYEATLTGTGQSNTDFDRSNFGVTGSLGYYYTKNWLFSVKQGLQANTRQAIEAGLFGVPSFVVDGKVFWGQDALPMLRAYLQGDSWFAGPDWDAVHATAVGIRRQSS